MQNQLIRFLSSRRIRNLAFRGRASDRLPPGDLLLFPASYATQARPPPAPATARGTIKWKETLNFLRFSGPTLFPARSKSSWAGEYGEMADQHEEAAVAADNQAAQQQPQQKRGGGGHGRRGGKGGGGGGGGQPREVLVSKALSKLLRHQAENAGLTLDEGGYAPLDKVLAYGPIKSLKVTFSDIQAAVTTSDKQRFALKPNAATNATLDETSTEPSHWLIRANQGHSIKVDSASLLTPITLEAGNVPEVVVHGTYFAFWKQIEASGGLKRMGRNHVHFATGLPGDERGVVSGMRKDAEVLVYVDVGRALREEEEGGLKWWISENGVVLTEGDGDGVVPCRLFKEVVAREEGSGVGVLWKDGEKVAELPEGLRMRAPPGKGRGGRGGRRGGKA
ncbi:Tpt1/KptA family RNA 2'-phosphotransferase [Colletotrichum orchidophilum]|uniref:2'-phosphotransferase n=1 Tax=Colletotrichum orchidophilum TaxID=1209926 RepID=A0A1G4ASB6_9PEZI|nr:Tpt1/KptA family RNA 2'-phosphotransferase [Colletotrichum orchidophilum]OHE92015.1 Tpt1/KptA family RNA 2'-phosphotransferase [Colletotrichum orchidophilum]